ncbi:MAG: glutamate mutase L [Candidatus Bathyarchaeota archaeon]|nr:MAG: glutamate mutase L [Candidatus Bathyarchaeota archaeon]
MEYILATDVGSTTTKARFFMKRENGEWRFVVAGETPTTVEAPYEDVTMGVKNAVREVEELTGHRILAEDGEGIITPFDGERGVDLYCTTSSAGGGLQMMVTGVIKRMTGESAERSALGAGAIVMEIFATNDKRPIHRKIQQIRNLRPDMILMAGGTDGGTISHVVNMAELIKSADPKPRLGSMYSLPIVYAGNQNATDHIQKLLADEFALSCIENIRPVLEVENTEPARRAIHELFMEHVMSHAPGYDKLMKWTDVDIMPTPAGEGMAMQLIADRFNRNVLGVGLGGATTNIYSIFDKRFVRSVSANLGMSYSICNVLKETGLENIMRWLPFDIDPSDVRNRLRNKMIRPTTIPQTLQELIVEHAVAREALRLGLVHHRSIATTLKGVRQDVAFLRGITTQAIVESYIDMMKIDIVAGTGGLLSHAPRRVQSLMILNDAFQTEGVTMMFQDSVFMMPHLGVVSTVHRDAAWQIFDLDCLVRLGTIVAPRGETDPSEAALDVTLEMPRGETLKESLKGGEVKMITLPERQVAQAIIHPGRNLDVGAGPGQELKTSLEGGVVGLMLDTRGRPLVLPEEFDARKSALLRWITSLEMYPEKRLTELS